MTYGHPNQRGVARVLAVANRADSAMANGEA
jgi:hypothetical protein